MKLMDSIRSAWGIQFPADVEALSGASEAEEDEEE